MTAPRTRSLILALLLTWALPLQGFAAAQNCGVGHAVAHTEHCAQGGAAAAHHDCGGCCATAIVLDALAWTPPRGLTPPATVPRLHTAPTVNLDRIDRPPRHSLS